MEWIVQLPILFFSIMIHEVCHGWAALRLGDDTAKRHGRLTLNPLAHADPLGSLALPLFCLLYSLPLVGWAKPVPVNASRVGRGPRGALIVSLAGPVSNLSLAALSAVLFRLTAALPAFFPDFQNTLLNALLFGVSLNVFLAFFNLLPIHPLDGGKVLSRLLPSRARGAYDRHAPYGFMIILALVALGVVGPVVAAPSRWTIALLARAGLIW